MIHEMRIYEVVPGRMPDMLARFRDHTTRIWKRHGIIPVAFWTTLIGESNNELTYILAWDSLAARETQWTAFATDPEWLRVKAETEKNGMLVAKIRNQILAPTDFSAIQ